MTSPYLRSLAALAVGRARVWQPRLPARFEVEDAFDDDGGWSEVEAWTEPDRGAGSGAVRVDRTPAPRSDGPDDLSAPDGAGSGRIGEGDRGDVRPADRPAGPDPADEPPAASRASDPTGPTASDDRTDGPDERPRPAPVLHVTVREVGDGSPPADGPRKSEGPTEVVVEDRRPAPAPPSSSRSTFRTVPRRVGPDPSSEGEAARSTPRRAPAARVAAAAARVAPPRPAVEDRPPAGPAPVHVHIGRVDVRAVVAAPAPAPVTAEPPAVRPGPDLERYLLDGSGS